MKVRAIEEQSYFNENKLPITTGKVYEVVEEFPRFVDVEGDDGTEAFLLPGEYEVVE